MIQKSHSWGYTQRNATQVTPEAPAHHIYCSNIHKTSYGNSQDATLQMNWLRKCGTYTQWNSTQPWRRMKSYYSQVNRWNWRTSLCVRLARVRRPKIICSPSYEVFRSRANTSMLLDLGHMLRGEHIREVLGIGRKPKKCQCLMPLL
jgi:hypothetical protein